MKHTKVLGFTLVELIVVITIIAVLATVGFVSYSNYLTGARDSNRISQVTRITDALQVYSSTKSLPLPDSNIQVLANGTLVGYQGYAGVNVLEGLEYANGGKDPKDDVYFTYYLNAARNSFQVLSLMEEIDSVAAKHILPQGFAADYSNRYPKVSGRELGVLISTATTTLNTPAQELPSPTNVDLVTTGTGFKAIYNNSESVSGTGITLRNAIPNGSCARIKESGASSGNGTYTINPKGTGNVTVYCEMEENGGGWTLVARSVTGGVGGFVITTNTGALTTPTLPYIFNPTNLVYSSQMYAANTTNFAIDGSYFKTLATTSASLTQSGHTLAVSGTTGGTAGDGYNGKQGMIFVK